MKRTVLEVFVHKKGKNRTLGRRGLISRGKPQLLGLPITRENHRKREVIQSRYWEGQQWDRNRSIELHFLVQKKGKPQQQPTFSQKVGRKEKVGMMASGSGLRGYEKTSQKGEKKSRLWEVNSGEQDGRHKKEGSSRDSGHGAYLRGREKRSC